MKVRSSEVAADSSTHAPENGLMEQSSFQRAYEAFHRQLNDLLAQGYHGQWVLYHDGVRIAISPDRDRLYQIVRHKGLREEEILVDLVAIKPEDIDTESLLYR
jgi:hypothetical protein